MFTHAFLPISINTLSNQSRRRTMKNSILTFAAMGFMAGTLLTGCGKTAEQKVEAAKEDVKEATKENIGEAKQALKDAQADYRAEWQKFKSESEQQIQAN
jgi:hypothetical protein